MIRPVRPCTDQCTCTHATPYVFVIYAGNANGYSNYTLSDLAIPEGRTTTPLAGGAEHSLAVLANNTVWTWGQNDFGQLGDGATTTQSTGETVPGLSGVVSVAAEAQSSLALRSDGTVSAWGDGTQGQLGDNTTADSYTPVHVTQDMSGNAYAPVTALGDGEEQSLAVTADGTLWEWGQHPDPFDC